jgi:predicted DNA-binding transcriptional regulator AlpA
MSNIYSLNSDLLNRKKLTGLLGISRTTLWRIERNDPTFPKSVNLGIKKALWFPNEITAWAASTRQLNGVLSGHQQIS